MNQILSESLRYKPSTKYDVTCDYTSSIHAPQVCLANRKHQVHLSPQPPSPYASGHQSRCSFKVSMCSAIKAGTKELLPVPPCAGAHISIHDNFCSYELYQRNIHSSTTTKMDDQTFKKSRATSHVGVHTTSLYSVASVGTIFCKELCIICLVVI